MNQAAAIVQSGMGMVHDAAQQATFAVDDFLQQWSATGSVAQGLRGAGNNLTMLAASLGSIKAQLAVIGVISAAQLLGRYWEKQKSDIDAATAALELYREELTRVSGRIGRNAEFRSQVSELKGMRTVAEALERRGSGRESIQSLSLQRGENQRRIEELQKELADEKINRENDRQLGGLNAEEPQELFDARIKAIAEEIAEREKVGRQLQDEIDDQRRLNMEVDKHLKRLQELRQERIRIGGAGGRLGGRLGAVAAAGDIDKEIAELRDSLRPSMSLADMFRLLPSANTMGSVGAISTISAAMIGPKNARDAGPALQKETNRILQRIEELEKKKKGLLEVVGL